MQLWRPGWGVWMALDLDELVPLNKVVGPASRNGKEEGERSVIRRPLERRFGSLPTWAEKPVCIAVHSQTG